MENHITHDEAKAIIQERTSRIIVNAVSRRTLNFSIGEDEPRFLVFNEFRLRSFNNAKTTSGGSSSKGAIDVAIMVAPCETAVNKRLTFSIGIEIKDVAGDLLYNDRLEKYRSHMDYLFYGVTDELVKDALRKAENMPDVGVLNFQTGQIYKFPKRAWPSWEVQANVRDEALFRHLNKWGE